MWFERDFERFFVAERALPVRILLGPWQFRKTSLGAMQVALPHLADELTARATGA